MKIINSYWYLLFLILFTAYGKWKTMGDSTVPSGVTLNAEQGTLTSKNYPKDYPRNENNTWLLWTGVEPTAKLQITFNYFDIEDCLNCQCDYIQVVSNMTSSKRLCGSVLPNGDGVFTMDHVSGYVQVRFVSNDNNIQRSGFLASYKITGKTVSTTPTTTLPTTVSCFAVQCPKCAISETSVYRYFHNASCPSFCACQKSVTTTSGIALSNITTQPAKKTCLETYENQGYIKTYTYKRPRLPDYPPLYPLNYDCNIRIDLGDVYRVKDKAARIRFLKFDVANCQYGYDGHTCSCDYLTLRNVRGLENKRICDVGYIDFNRDYYFRPSSRSDRYIEMRFHSNSFLAKTGYLIEYEVMEAKRSVCTKSTCSSSCTLGTVTDFAGCNTCQCITTTTTTTRSTTTRATTPVLYKSKLLSKLQRIIGDMQKFDNEIKHSRVTNYGK